MARKKYDENSIKTLSARDFCRLRPGVYIGSNATPKSTLLEIFSNSLDEHTSGRGNIITVTINSETNTYSVEDNGQGFKINTIKPDTPEHTILQSAFEDFNTSGKYDEKSGSYTGSLGCNGQGAKCTNFLSLYLDVISYDGKKYEHIWFKDGIFQKREVGESDHHSGTTVTWQPDPQFFQNSYIDIGEFKKLFEDISALCPELTIKFIVDGKELTYHTENGIQDLVARKTSGKELLNKRFYVRKETETDLFDIVLTYTSDYSENIIAYANYGLTESGVHISTLKADLVYQLNKYAKENGLLKKNEDSITQTEISEGLFIVFNVKTSNIKYDSQVKTRIVDLNKTLINQVIGNDFAIWLVNNPKDAKIIVDKALMARKARAAAQKAKEGIRNAGNKGKKFISLPSALLDAFSKDREETELFICEGQSAMNGLASTRNGKTQAIFPIRGKILNCMKATPDKVYANQEISNIVKSLGLDIDKITGKLIYDKKKLRYGKILLATDADEDAAQIKMLLINMFWWLCPEIVINGHLGAVVPPLFRVTTKKNEYIYLKDHDALDDYHKKHKNESFIINRMKGYE